jgi:nucleoside-diphosphate-sugar epimerase
MREILLTGGTGLIGRELSCSLLEEEDVECLKLLVRNEQDPRLKKLLSSARDLGKRVDLVEGDLLSSNLGSGKVLEALGDIGEVYHLAADTKLSGGMTGPSSVNILGTKNLLNLAGSLGVDVFNHLSSAYACGIQDERVPETKLRIPSSFRSPYEKTKLGGEGEVYDFCEGEGIDFNVFRPSIVLFENLDQMGIEGQTIYRYLSVLQRALKEGHSSEHFRLRGDLSTELNVVFSTEVVRNIILARKQKNKGRTYNLLGIDLPLSEIVNLVESETDRQGYYLFSQDLREQDLTRAERLIYHGSEPFWNYLDPANSPIWETKNGRSIGGSKITNLRNVRRNLREFVGRNYGA